ncbi:hypothetical protein [Thiohalomonas denitrificans]|uniref:hypothetical protein n=1 Tax=Thiohalomonas denitrificans TaxID=415747 RepID=UPI0026E9D4B6|nr:hypothetical protein [Thiohalomonas denitrificans]
MSFRIILLTLFAAASALLLSSCSDNKQYETAICALADTSGTYVKEKKKIVKIIQAGILPKLLPGDSLFLIAIDSSSYDEKNIKGQLKLNYRPSQANQQRIEFAQVLDKFEKEQTSARYTDISGAMMLCKGRLETTMAGTQIIFIFSDMKEELKPGIKRSFDKNEFENINIAAMNVIKLSEDNTDPQVFRSRIKKWEKRISDHGAASWNANLEPVDITKYIDDLR